MPRGLARDGGALTAAAPPRAPADGVGSATLPLGWRARAALTALVVLPLLEWVSFARIEHLLVRLGRRLPTRRVDPESAARWVDRLLGRLPGPWAFSCLRRATVLFHLLRAAGYPIELCIGVRREAGGALHAHAWLLHDGVLALEPLAVAERVALFTEIARFPSGGVGAIT